MTSEPFRGFTSPTCYRYMRPLHGRYLLPLGPSVDDEPLEAGQLLRDQRLLQLLARRRGQRRTTQVQLLHHSPINQGSQ